MRNLTDRIDDIKRMVSTTNQNFKRTLEIIKEMLKNSEFDQVLYGEAKSIEDSINLFETNVDEEVIKTIARFQPMAINLRFLISVIKIFNIYINRFNISYLKTQKFLNPYPLKLALRSDLKAYKWNKFYGLEEI